MLFIELLLIAAGLSMDAFAVSVCAGLTMKKVTVKKALIAGLYFGIFQAAMPVIGYFAASFFADAVSAISHWVAFALLCLIGGKMIYEGLQKRETKEEKSQRQKNPDAGTFSNSSGSKSNLEIGSSGKSEDKEASLRPAAMLPLAVATSIDALAVGVSFAFLKINIVPAVLLIGATTLVLSMAGVKIGNIFGRKYSSKAEITGGAILILLGVKILAEGLGVIG